MPKYRVHGTISGKTYDYLIEANHGADALRHAVRPHIPEGVKKGSQSYYYWYEDNVRMDAIQLEPSLEPAALASVPEPPAVKSAKTKSRKKN